MLRRTILGAGTAVLLAFSPAFAGEAGDILRDNLYAGTISAGLDALAPLAEAGDSEAEFGVGALRFFSGIEHLTQSLYRYGLAAPDTGDIGPILAFPIATNPKPEHLTYEKVRDVLQVLVTDMDAAKEALVRAGEAGDYVVLLDPLKFRVDVDGDGKASDGESIASIMAKQFGADFSQPATDGAPAAIPDASIGFDRADANWLAGYSQVFAAHADFLLAHDFSDLVNASFHRFFPHAGLPMEKYQLGGSIVIDPWSDSALGDVIAAVHSLNMKVVDADRLKGVLARLKLITAFSRQNWQAILAETDDNRELVPSPRQTPIVPDGVVTQQTVDAWMATLDTADEILDGKLLVPHWRFKQGFDLPAYFNTAKRTDIVMLLTGYDALPFLRDGPVANAASFAAANKVFGDQLLGYAFWFN